MPLLKNVSPVGDLDIPLLGRVVAAGEEFEVTAEQAGLLLPQEANFVKVDEKKTAAKSE